MNSIESILSIFVLVVLGYILKRLDIISIKDIDLLNKLVMTLFLPSLVFLAIYKSNSSQFMKLIPLPFINILIAIILGTICFTVFYKVLNYSLKRSLSITFPIMLMNTAFVGFPVVLSTYGSEGLIGAAFFDIGTSVLFIVLNILLIFIFGGSFKETISQVAKFPTLIALILGIIANLASIPLDFLVVDILEYLASATIPVIMLALGVSLDLKIVKDNLNISLFSAIARLVGGPLIAIFLVSLFGIGAFFKNIVLLQAAMPSAMLALVLSIEYDLEYNITAACVFSSTMLSLISLPIIISIL